MFVLLEVLGQLPDALRQDSDLDFCRTGVLIVFAKLLDRLGFRLGIQSSLFRACAFLTEQMGIQDDLPLSTLPARLLRCFSFANSGSSKHKDTTRHRGIGTWTTFVRRMASEIPEHSAEECGEFRETANEP